MQLITSADRGTTRSRATAVRAALAAATLALLAGCGSTPGGTAAAAAPPRDGALTGPRLDGGALTVPLEGRERPLLLVFWASWCQPCDREAPAVARLAADTTARLDVLGVCVDTDREAARAFVARHALPYDSVFDPDLVVSDRFGVSETPTFLLLARDGARIAAAGRLSELRPQLEAALLAAPATAPGQPPAGGPHG